MKNKRYIVNKTVKKNSQMTGSDGCQTQTVKLKLNIVSAKTIQLQMISLKVLHHNTVILQVFPELL